MAENDPLDQLRKATAALIASAQGGSQSGTAVMEPEDDETAPDVNSPLGRLRAATASLKASVVQGNHVPGSEKIVPFTAAIPTTTPSEQAAKVGQPPVRLGLPDSGFDTTKIPRNVFTNDLAIPEQTPDQVRAQNAAEDAATAAAQSKDLSRTKTRLSHEQEKQVGADQEAASTALTTGSRRLPIPAFTEPGPTNPYPLGVRMSNVGELTDLAAENLNRPDIPKTREEAFATGVTADAVKTLNDMFLSPVGIASLGVAGASANALAKSGKAGANALKLMEEYQAMEGAGATAADLLEQRAKIQAAIQASYKAQQVVKAGATTGRVAAGGFGVQGANSVVEGVQEKDGSKILSGLAQIALAGSGEVAIRKAGGVEAGVKAATAADAAQKFSESRPVTSATRLEGTIGPQQEPLAPESPETLQAQTDALANGTNKTVYFPKGTKNLPAPPENAKVTVVPGEQAGAGTWYHTEDVKPILILKRVKDGTFGELLGNHQGKQEALSSGTPTAIVARDADGTEIKASLVDSSKPEVVAAQVATLQRQFPDAKIGVEKPEDVVHERMGTKPKEVPGAIVPPESSKTSASPNPPPGDRWTADRGAMPGEPAWFLDGDSEDAKAAITEVQDPRDPGRSTFEAHLPGGELLGKFGTVEEAARHAEKMVSEGEPENERAIRLGATGAPSEEARQQAVVRTMGESTKAKPLATTAGTAPADLQPVIAQHAPDLLMLARQARRVDPDLADGLSEMAHGRLHSPGDLETFVNENVHEPKARAELTNLVADYAAKSADEEAQASSKESLDKLRAATASIRESSSEVNQVRAVPEIGDRVQVNDGPLKGKTVEVTKAGVSGVYVREADGPVKFVKSGDFEPAQKETKPASKPKLIGATAYSNPLFDPEVWKSALGYLKPSEAAGQADLRARTGELARKQAVLQEKLKAERNRWRGRGDVDMLAFADMVENGEADRKSRGVTLTPKTQAMLDAGKKSITTQDKNLAATLRALLDEGRSAVQGLGTGKLESFIENYFPHIWEQKGSKVGAAIGQVFGKRPLEGPKSFLKKREIPTTAEGFDKDLKPVTSNPVDMAVLKMHEMNRYVMAHRLLKDLKAAGSAKFVRFGQKAPDGWQPLDDKVFQVLQYSEVEKGMIVRGRYYAPEEVAQPINRYVATGLKGVPIYDVLRSFGNSLNQVQLGLSGFHLGTTSLNAVISQFALGAKQAARGEVVKGAKNIFTAPAAPVRNLIQGGNVLKDYLRPDQAKKYASTADAVERAGGRAGIGEEYIDNRIEKMRQSFANKKYFTGILQSIPAAIELQAIPVLKWTVPRMKLGAFHDLAADIMDRAQENNWKQDRVRSELQKAWDSIDNRFGQVVYDNLNWNKVAKDLAFIGVRSVGWNYGTWRELGGGVRDTAAQVGAAMNGKGFDVTDRMAYTFALPVTIAMLGALYMYAHTGKWPQSAKDYFYPKNGKVEEDGTEARASLPSYMKDVFAMSQHPIDTAMHKVNPAVGLITEMVENKDFYGNEIRNTDDPAMAQLGQALAHVGKSFLPFTFRSAQKRAQIGQKGVESQVENFLGIAPAPRNQERTDAEAMAHDLIQRRSPAGAHTTAEQKKQQRILDLEQEARSTTTPQAREALKVKLAAQLDAGTITEQDAITAIKRSRTPGLVHQFKELTIPEALKVWDVASPKERQQLMSILETKVQNGFPKMTREDQDHYRPLLRRALTGLRSQPPSGAPMFPPNGGSRTGVPMMPPVQSSSQ
jgi:hypothetical protein